MARFLGFRILQLPLILAIIYLVTFALCWVAPGDPFNRTDKKLPPQVEARLRRQFHAENWYTFLAYYPYNILTKGDFGPSLAYPSITVNDVIKERLPKSVLLGFSALVIAMAGGIAIGTLAAVKRDGVLDWLSLMLALFGTSLPSFVAASLLIAGFALQAKLFPADGWHGMFSEGMGAWRQTLDIMWHMVLPSLALSLLPMAYITRLTRVSMIDVFGSDFVRTARAKGLSKSRVLFKHCLRNAILPVLSYVGPAAASTMVGSFVIEKVFNIPGLGRSFVDSVLNRDQTLILGTVLVEASLVMVMNLFADFAYSFVDPRINVVGK